VLQGRERFIEQYIWDKPRMEALLVIYLDQLQQAEDAAWQLATLRFPDTAEGVQLDVLGEIVGQPRNGLEDVDYAPLIRGRIQANRSDGTPPSLYAVALAALSGSGAVRFRRGPGVGDHRMVFDQVIPFDESILNSLLQDARSAGFRLVTIFQMVSAATSMRGGAASDYPTFNAATGFDSAATPGTGTGQPGRAMDHTS
jgi:hypothetical protein